ncbi:hypothetical protein SAPIO_CDS1884 [Scedosporium apiospermum]|uniref:Amidase domain-containing protein n=1 Tax=Pseudallescheria apiosperma TaxID=563466 RepID=A0A084GDY8_PSEDA|nr:uncharacterized protein SAPIO_CDS1884 [Scedosporium apiospermum]KEZ45550.1 hypothetical protein SAPIO_CDS1884 [Scedosporium apiospermum]
MTGGDDENRPSFSKFWKRTKAAGKQTQFVFVSPEGSSKDEAQTPTAEEKAQARRAQVRKAQTEHRQRKVNYVKKLELDVNRLRDAIAEAEVDVAKLRKENAEMKSGLASIDPETAWKNKPLPSLPGIAEGGAQQLDDLGDLADLDLNAFDFSLPLDSASISSSDMLACLGMDDTMQKPCYRIASSPSRSLPTSSGSPWTFPNSPPLSTQKEDLAINFILALEHVCWDHLHLTNFPAHSDDADDQCGHTLLASTFCLASAPSSVYDDRAQFQQTPSEAPSSPWPTAGLTLQNLHRLAASLHLDDKELTPVQGWFELASRYTEDVLLNKSVMESLKLDIHDLSIAELQRHMIDGKFSAWDLTECYLERIRRLNPVLKAVIEVNPDALTIADERDIERKKGTMRGPLHGIPYLVKDNICTKDKMQTTAGSRALIGTAVDSDAVVVAKLREAGAVLLGHANLSEWACMRTSYYSEGYSGRGGQCRNPHNLAEHPGGSSSGSAVAVAISMCAFALGTETDGSVTYPSDRNGVVGLKPTLGVTSRRGVIPESHNLDVVGPIAKNVEDAAVVLSVISGECDQEAPVGVKGSEICNALDKGAIDRIRKSGAEVFEDVDFPSAEDIIPPVGWDWNYPREPSKSEFTVVKTDFYNQLKAYLASLAENPWNLESLEDIIEFNKKNAEDEGGLPGLHGAWPMGQDNFHRCADSRGIEDEAYHSAVDYIRQKSREEGIDAVLRSKGGLLDGILVPIQADGGVANQVAAKAGYPAITIPVAVNKDDDVPFGLVIIQTAGREDLLIKYGSAIEHLIRGRPRARFLNIDADNYMYVGVPPDGGDDARMSSSD